MYRGHPLKTTQKAGERYLFTVDVQLAEDSPWPYQEEEFEISFIFETAPFFTHEPVGKHEPGLVLHRYGGTYGTAEYLLTASKKMVPPGKIKVTLLNGWGLPIAQLELECEVKEDGQDEARRATRPTKQVQHPAQPPELPKVEQRVDAVLDDHQQQELVAKQLAMVGWEVWSVDMLATLGPNKQLQVPRGFIALRGYRSVEDDYLLIIDRVIIGIVKVHVGEELLPGEIESIALPGFIVEISNLKFEDSILVKTEIENEFPFVYHTTADLGNLVHRVWPVLLEKRQKTTHDGDAGERQTTRARLMHVMMVCSKGVGVTGGCQGEGRMVCSFAQRCLGHERMSARPVLVRWSERNEKCSGLMFRVA